MLEPVAAVIANTVLCGRSTLEHPIPLHSVSRIIKYPASSRSLPGSFFNPQPRRAELKGKEKALDDSVSGNESSRVREWACTSGRAIFPSSKRARAIMTGSTKTRILKLPSFQRTASSITRHASHHRLPSPRLLNRPVQSHNRHQTRQASQIAELQHSDAESLPASSTSEKFNWLNIIMPSGPLYDRRLIAVQHFRRMMAQPSDCFDLDTSLAIYEAVEMERGLSLLSVGELLLLSERALERCDQHYDKTTPVGTLYDWGTRLSRLATALEHRVVAQSEYAYRTSCALGRARALMGELEDAARIVESTRKLYFPYEDRWRAIHAFQSLVQAVHRYYDSARVFNFVISHWATLGPHMSRWSPLHQHGKPMVYGRELRTLVQRIVSQIQHPVSLLANTESSDVDHRRLMGEFLIESYSFSRLPFFALDVHNELKRQGIHTHFNPQLSLVRALVKEDAMGPAKELFASISPKSTFRFYLQTGLYMFAHDGDHVRAEEYYNQLNEQEWRNPNDIATLMHSYATQGKSDEVTSLFDQYFPRGQNGRRRNFPNLIHFSVAIYSHALNGDVDGLNMWLEDLVLHSLRPDVHIFTMLAQAFAKRGDLDSVATVLSQMRSSGLTPNEVTYHNLITLLAYRRDPVGAEAMYKRAIQEGIVPTRRLISTVMNAHVQAGSWKGVIRVFDYIRQRPALNIRLTIEIYNTLLKAYILIGAPFRVVSKLFRKLHEAGVRPDNYTYALLIRSACDADELDIAKDIYEEMCELSEKWESNVHVNVYVLTILMGGYLRRRDVMTAREIYDEMGRRGIQLDATTFSIMIHSYAQNLTQEGIVIAEEFITDLTKTLDKAWLRPQIVGRDTAATALEKIYGPLLHAYGRLSRSEDVERTLKTLLEKGGELSLGTLTSLLDVYRRSGNIEGVQECWPQIYELGLKHSKESLFNGYTVDDPTVERLRANILCIPLSIYIDALSAAGKHMEVAAVWKLFQDKGFYFDAYNWNYLLVALLRAGEVSRAFQIGEKIILPYQRHCLTMNLERDPTPDSPLSFDGTEKKQSAEVMTLVSETRAVTPRYRRRFMLRNDRRLHGMLHLEYENDEFGDDFAEPLHLLYQIAPSWNVWRIHPVGMRALLWSLHALSNGHVIHALGQEPPQEDLAESQDKATELLTQLKERCPDTVELVRRYGHRLRKKLGVRGYEQKFNSS
ncbi:hypothetical protein L218DRAFT_330951 [Marasmius fiardii PR-910]|nr:hypothetical protein L218DRAFT_330951 [Marasmius fiardii PR-910]